METGINCVRQLRNYVSQIIHKHYYDKSIYNVNNISIINYIHFEVFCRDRHLFSNIYDIISDPENFMKYSFFIDEIKTCLHNLHGKILNINYSAINSLHSLMYLLY